MPVTPSNIGVFQLAVVAVLHKGWGISTDVAFAYGVILQAVEMATAAALGVPALVREGLTWSDVRAQALATAPVELDPYPSTTDVDPGFPDMWCAALSHSMSRFEGCRARYKMARSGGVGAFTADNFPVFDYVRPNVYGIFDSNHGYKMIGVGREVAKVVVGEHSSLLYPFRFERFATGDLHPVSHSPYPWS